MFNGSESLPLSGSSSLQSYGDGQMLPDNPPPLTGNTCPVCRKTFERLYNLKVHLRKHTGETPYDCPIKYCKKQFKWRSSMAHHVRAHHDASETVGIEVKCHARRNDKNLKCPNTDRQTANHAIATALGLSSARVKKSTKKKAVTKVTKVMGGGNLPTDEDFRVQMQPHQNVSIFPQWGPGPSHQRGIPGFIHDIETTEADKKEAGRKDNPDHFPQSVQTIDKLAGRGNEPKNKDDQLFEMVSEIFSRSTDMLQNCEENIVQIHHEGFSDDVDTGLMFLADGSEDATDAEMESRAHCEENLSLSTSKETNASSDIPFGLA